MEKVIKSEKEWRDQLTSEEFYVCRQKGTERAFTGTYNQYKKPGTYVCTCCGQSLFDATISLIRARDGRVLLDQYVQKRWQLKWIGVILWFELRSFALVVMRILVMCLRMAQPQQAFASV